VKTLITLQIPESMVELAQVVGISPEAILSGFMRDLLRLPGSNGSDERDLAGEYLLRCPFAFEKYEALRWFLAVDRRRQK
jgi:hypothetical protein